MDPESLRGVSRLPPPAGGARRVQRQVHVQSARAARRVLCDAAAAPAGQLSQLLPPGRALAVLRHPTGHRLMRDQLATWFALAQSPVPAEEPDAFAEAVSAGLGAHPKRLPPWMLYDDAGSELFELITRLPE